MAQSLTLSAQNPDALIQAAEQKLNAHDAEGAKKLYQAFLERCPSSSRCSEAKTKLGWCYYVSGVEGDKDQAERLWQEVTRAGKPNDEWVAESRWHLVQSLAGPRGKWKDATALCAEIAKTATPGSFRHEQALYTRAWLLWVHKQWGESLTAFHDLTAAYPENAVHPPIVAYIKECEENATKGKDEANR